MVNRVIKLEGRGLRGDSYADTARRSGLFGILPTDDDETVIGKINADAAASADRAESAANVAELAALTAPNVYPTTADGLAAVGEGDTFWVQGVDGPTLYRKESGAAVELDTILSKVRLGSDLGASFVTTKQSFTGAVARTIADFFEDEISVMSFLPLTERVKVRLGTSTDDLGYAFNAAINACEARGGGSVRVPAGLYHASGIEPKSSITLACEMATIRLPAGASQPMIYRNSGNTLFNFSISNVKLDGNGEAQDGIHITEPSPSAPKKTWQYGTLFNVEITGFGTSGSNNLGLYCPTPGRIRLLNSWVHGCDIGIGWDREHIDIYGTQIEGNRIAIRSTGNHFVMMHCSIAHNSEAAWTTDGTLGAAFDVYEASFIACTILDNPKGFEGLMNYCRFVACRFTGASGTDESFFDGRLYRCVITGNTFNQWSDVAIKGIWQRNLVSGNIFYGGATPPPAAISTPSVASSNITLLNRIESNHIYSVMVGIDLANPTHGLEKNTIARNWCENVGCVVRAADVISHNSFDENEGFDLKNDGAWAGAPGVGIDITIHEGTGQVNSLSVSRNKLIGAPLEAVKVTSAVNGVLSLWIDDNRIIDANLSDSADTDAISLDGTVFLASSMCLNKVRNSNAGHAQHAISVTTSSPSSFDNLFALNISRNMRGANAYKLSAGEWTIGTNVGSVDES